MKIYYLPNTLTAIRLLLAGPISLLILFEKPWWSIFLFFIAAVSDALDGSLARHYGWQSKLGAMLDPLADKVLLVSTYISLTLIEQLPIWLSLLVVGRDICIITGTFVYRCFAGPVQFKPSFLGKLCTLLQLGFIMITMILGASHYDSRPIIILQPLVAMLTIVSGIQYVIEWTNQGVDRTRKQISVRKKHCNQNGESQGLS